MRKAQRGQSKIEFALILLVIVLMVLFSLQWVGHGVANAFCSVSNGIGGNGALADDGLGSNGQLGNGGTGNVLVPTSVSGFCATMASVGGGSHTLAVKTDGTLWAWGNNSSGQLGNGTVGMAYPTPALVQGITGPYAALSTAEDDSYIVRADGTVWATGRGSEGELGNGVMSGSAVPVQATGLSSVKEVAGGYRHAMALKTDGTVWVWGDNSAGQLGLGGGGARTVPTQITTLGPITSISADGYHSIALAKDGSVWTWGDNTWDTLGTGASGGSSNVPVQVVPANLSYATAITAGWDFNCAIRGDQTTWCWGADSNGQLGDNGSSIQTMPVEVVNPSGAPLTGGVSMASGHFHAIEMRSDHTVWDWGMNDGGQLGNNTQVKSNVPVQAGGVNDATGIGSGSHHTLILTLRPLS